MQYRSCFLAIHLMLMQMLMLEFFWMLTTMFVILLLLKNKINFSLFVRAGLSFLAPRAFQVQQHALYMDKQFMDNKYETHGCYGNLKEAGTAYLNRCILQDICYRADNSCRVVLGSFPCKIIKIIQFSREVLFLLVYFQKNDFFTFFTFKLFHFIA